MIILAQAKLDGTRWQVVPAYLCTVTCTGLNALGRVKGVRLPKIVCRLVALAGAAGAAVSTLAGVFAPVFPMPKPTGPYRVGKTTRLWIDRNRRSWLLKTKRKLGAQALPEHRMMMVNIWYPAAREDDGSGKDSQPPWPADEEAEARFAERAAGFAAVEETAANSTPRRVNVLKKQREETAKHQARFEKKRAEAKKSGRLRRAHWLDPTLATTLAESFYLPGWVVDYFRLVKMDAVEDAPVADPPRVLTKQKSRETDNDANETETHCETTSGPGFPVVLFSHSFTGVKEQNSALLQEIASWGHIVVAVDHPHDAALVLYPDGSTADFRGYDMPKESEPRNWWRFRHEHARWRALDLAHALERTVELSYDESSPLRGKIDLSRISCIGHSFGGAAAVMLAQMDPRITSVVALDPWMWPLGRETAMAGCPCPLLVFEAPEFMWNRDIFCVTNGETSSLMCAATAPQAVKREESGREEEETAEERAEERPPRASSDDSATEPNFSSPSDDVHRVEDPSKPPPGFLGDSVDGHAGVGFYNEHGYYYTSNPPKSPTSRTRSAHFRPQHPRLGSSENLASMTSMASLSSARSLGSVGSLEGEFRGEGTPDFGKDPLDEHKERVPTAEEEAAAAVASYASGRPPRDPSSSLSFLAGEERGGVIERGVGSGDFSGGSAAVSPHLRHSGSWSNVLRAVNAENAEASSSGLKSVGSWGSLRRPFRRRSIGDRNRAGGGSVSSLGTSGYGAEMQRDPSGVAFKAVLAKTMHFDFTDIAMVAPLAATMFGVVGVGGREVHDVTSAATLRFLRMFNHPRDPDHSDPDAKALEKLRAKLLSTKPVASVGAATKYGFSGGNAVVEPAETSVSVSGSPLGEREASDDARVKNFGDPRIALPRLKLGKMGHPVARHRGVRGSLAARGGGVKGGRLAKDAAFRKSFDATHLPENWMDLEGIEGSDAERGDSEDDSEDKKNKSSEVVSKAVKNPDSRKASSAGRDEKDAGLERSARSFVRRRGDGEDETSGEKNVAASSDDTSDDDAFEVKPRVVRWVKSHEWRLDSERLFDAAQRREMRWLLHECRKLGTLIQPSDFVAMFPSFDADAVKRAALLELTSDEHHPPPKPLVWLAQMVVDGDIPRHTSEGGNHHGVPDEELEGLEARGGEAE